MNDVLQVAIDRQRELRDEIAELDQFIRLAQELLRKAKPQSTAQAQPLHTPIEIPAAEPAPERRRDRSEAARPEIAPPDTARPEIAGVEPEQERPQPAQAAAPIPGPAAETTPAERKFPWSNPQPPVRRGGDEPAGPTRHNLFRRDMSATG